MEIVTMQQDFRVDIPRSICDQLQIVPGDKLKIVYDEYHLELIPIPKDMCGLGKDINIESDSDSK